MEFSPITVIFDGTWTTLNEYIRLERARKEAAAAYKRQETQRAGWIVKSKFGGKKFHDDAYPLWIGCHWYVDSRADPDNVFFSIKFLLDGMVSVGFLRNDSQKEIKHIFHDITRCKKGESPRCELTLYPRFNERKKL